MSDRYNCIVGAFLSSNDSVSGMTSLQKSNIYSVYLQTDSQYKDLLGDLDGSTYQGIASADLVSIFIPFHTIPGISGASGFIPCFDDNIPIVSESGINMVPNAQNIMPFKWSSGTNLIDRSVEVSGDGYKGVATDDTYLGDVDVFRNQNDVRGIGLRLPIMVAGWGYTLDDTPWPSGSGSGKFAGEVDNGYEVHPSKYIAAPIDMRYDTDRGVWISSTQKKHRHLKNTAADGGPAFAGFFR